MSQDSLTSEKKYSLKLSPTKGEYECAMTKKKLLEHQKNKSLIRKSEEDETEELHKTPIKQIKKKSFQQQEQNEKSTAKKTRSIIDSTSRMNFENLFLFKEDNIPQKPDTPKIEDTIKKDVSKFKLVGWLDSNSNSNNV